MPMIDLNTVLQAVILALSGWTLHGVHKLTVSDARMDERVSGHAGEIRKLKRDMEALQYAMVNIRAVLKMEERRTERVGVEEITD